MAKLAKFADMGTVEPHARIRALASYGNMVEVDPNIPIRRFIIFLIRK